MPSVMMGTLTEALGTRQGSSKEFICSVEKIAQAQGIANAVDPDGYLRFGHRPRDESGKPQLLPIGYRRIRRLTPRECERLQAFPDDWTRWGLDGNGKLIAISDCQRYKMMGNAVTVSVVEFIARRLRL